MSRRIKPSTAFKKDLKRERLTDRNVDVLLGVMIETSILNAPLPLLLRDHPLTGPWKDIATCTCS